MSRTRAAAVAEPPPEGLVVRRVRLDDLHADPANVNTHPERNLRAIADSLREFGQVEPLVVQAGTGKVIGGNGRLEAMRTIGITEADVVEVPADNVRATALAIALNRTAKTSEFDETALAETLRALQSEDFNLAATGYTGDELDEMVARLNTEVPDGEWSDAMDGLPDGDKSPFEQMTFTVTGEQAESIRNALGKAKEAGPFVATGNENSNGNALARVAELYLALG